MFKRKTAGILLFVSLACAAAGLFLTDTTASAASTPNASLFLPASYEQYLVLESPTSFDISEEYIVVADGHTLYIYDREEGKYSAYEHKKFSQPSATANISRVQIAEVDGENNDRIFFSDSDLHLYTFSSSENELSAQIIDNVPTSSFLIDEKHDALFTANAAVSGNVSLTRYPLSGNFSTSEDSAEISNANSPLLAIDGETLYLVYSNTNVRTCPIDDLDTGFTDVITSRGAIAGLQSIAFLGEELYYSVRLPSPDQQQNGLYRYKGDKLDLGKDTSAGITSLTVYNDSLYCIMGNSIYLLNIDEEKNVSFADFEISSSSSSVGRLSGAKDSVRAGKLLVTADTGNNRISVYDMQKRSFAVIPVDYSPMFVATDGKIVAAATTNSIFTYTCDIDGNWSDAEKLVLESGDSVSGIACVFGEVYYTSTTRRGVLGGNSVINNTSKGLTANLYGDLFVVYSDGKVSRFSEEAFTKEGSGEETDIKLPSDFTSLRADFEGNLYCLSEGVLYKNNEEFAEIDGKNYVYSKDEEQIQATTFALGFEDDEVYFGFGNFMVKTAAGALGFPTLGTISAEGVAEETGKVHAVYDDVKLVQVKKGAVGIRVDLGELKSDTEHFPYSSYERTSESAKGVLLDETGGFRLVALYRDRAYTVELFRKADTEEPPLSPAVEERSEALWLANEAHLYNYPALIDAKSAEALPRGSRLQVLAVLPAEEGEIPFAFVEGFGNARAEQKGYVPLSFLTSVDPNGTEAEGHFLGTLIPPEGGVVFTAADGTSITLTENTDMRFSENDDGTFTAHYTDESGRLYTAVVSAKMIDDGTSDALRISLIIILTVLALVIIGAYFFLLPRGKKSKK